MAGEDTSSTDRVRVVLSDKLASKSAREEVLAQVDWAQKGVVAWIHFWVYVQLIAFVEAVQKHPNLGPTKRMAVTAEAEELHGRRLVMWRSTFDTLTEDFFGDESTSGKKARFRLLLENGIIDRDSCSRDQLVIFPKLGELLTRLPKRRTWSLRAWRDVAAAAWGCDTNYLAKKKAKELESTELMDGEVRVTDVPALFEQFPPSTRWEVLGDSEILAEIVEETESGLTESAEA